jgi:hypothetical protein
MSRDEAIAKLAAIGIVEVTVPLPSSYDGETRDYMYLADVDNELLPNFKEPGNGNLDLDEWADGITVHGQMNLCDYVYPTMLKIQDAFPGFAWEDINGSDVEGFLQWVVHGKPPLESTMDGKTREIREKTINPQIEKKLASLRDSPMKNDDVKLYPPDVYDCWVNIQHALRVFADEVNEHPGVTGYIKIHDKIVGIMVDFPVVNPRASGDLDWCMSMVKEIDGSHAHILYLDRLKERLLRIAVNNVKGGSA